MELESGLAASANEPQHDTQPETVDSVLDTAFTPSAEGSESSDPPTSEKPTQEATADTTVQPQAQTETAKGAQAPPAEKWEGILANARTKAREDALAEHRDHLEVVQALKTDFPGTLARLLDEGAIDPRFSEALTAKAAAILSARKQDAKANTEPEPDLQTADGALVYSADQLRKWHQWNQKQTTAQLTEQFEPLLELKQQIEQHRQAQQDTQRAVSIAEKRGGSWKTMPFFAEHKDAILTRQQAIYEARKGSADFDPVDTPWQALQQAYSEVISTQALPKLQSQQTDNLVAVAARKRAGSSSDPAASAPAQPRKPRTPDEALDQVFGSA